MALTKLERSLALHDLEIAALKIQFEMEDLKEIARRTGYTSLSGKVHSVATGLKVIGDACPKLRNDLDRTC